MKAVFTKREWIVASVWPEELATSGHLDIASTDGFLKTKLALGNNFKFKEKLH